MKQQRYMSEFLLFANDLSNFFDESNSGLRIYSKNISSVFDYSHCSACCSLHRASHNVMIADMIDLSLISIINIFHHSLKSRQSTKQFNH